MNKHAITKSFFNLFFVAYGIMGLLGYLPLKAVLSTYMIVYFGVYYGFLEIRKKGELDEEHKKKETD